MSEQVMQKTFSEIPDRPGLEPVPTDSKTDTTKAKNEMPEKTKNVKKTRCCRGPFKFHSLKMFVLLICLLNIFTNLISGGYISSIITSLQTQYNFSTSKIGYIIASFDIMAIVSTPITSYIGSRYNKARIISICAILYAIGCGLFTLPFFFGGRYSLIKPSQLALRNMSTSNTLAAEASLNSSDYYDLCKSNIITNVTNLVYNTRSGASERVSAEDTCSRNQTLYQWPFIVFILAQLLLSWGAAPLLPLGITYMTENLEKKKKNPSLYTGIIYASALLGPAIGYLLSSLFLSLWINTPEPAPIPATDKRWVGLWYMGFLISAGFILLISFVLLSFPGELSSTQFVGHKKKVKRKAEKTKDSNKDVTVAHIDVEHSNTDLCIGRPPTPTYKSPVTPEKRNYCKEFYVLRIKGFLKSFCKLVLNARFSLLVIIMSLESVLVAIFANYMVFYTTQTYQLTQSHASIIVGGIIVPSAIIGAVLGGLVVKKFELEIEGCTNFIMFNSIVAVAGLLLVLFIRCEGPVSNGIDLSTKTINTSSVCDSSCNCSTAYSPICGVDSISYLSPCYAGCRTWNEKGYFNCICINSTNTVNQSLPVANNGACSRGCENKQIVFLVVLFILSLSESACLTPMTILLLKLVPKHLAPFSLGIARMAALCIAYVPTPIYLAKFIDGTCVLWNYGCIGDSGTCLEFDVINMHLYLFGIALGVKVLSCVLQILFSLHIHRSFLMRKTFRDKIELNHDMSSILRPKQKYKIEDEVATLDSESVLTMQSNVDLNKSGNSIVLKNCVHFDEF